MQIKGIHHINIGCREADLPAMQFPEHADKR